VVIGFRLAGLAPRIGIVPDTGTNALDCRNFSTELYAEIAITTEREK
jgi:hypothetical protein